MPQVSSAIDGEPQDKTRLFLSIGAIIAALYFGSEVFVPIALAILLSFVLAPGVRLLHSWHLGRIFPVVVMTALAFSVIFALSGLIATQLKELATELPKYESTMMKKVEALRGMATGGALQKAMDFATHLFAKPGSEQQDGRRFARDRGHARTRADDGGGTPTGADAASDPEPDSGAVDPPAGDRRHRGGVRHLHLAAAG